MMSDLKVAVLSLAHVHAASYVTILARTPGVSVLCADPGAASAPATEVRGRALAERLGAAYVDSFDEAFAWRPDAVIVCSENARHRDLVVRAAGEGCHVLCEKPLATSVADGEAMVAACREAGVFLMTACPVRFSPLFRRLRSAVDQGALGALVAATGTNNGKIPVGERAWFTDPDEAGGGALMDHVVHVADLLDVLTGGKQASEVWAATNTILHADNPLVRAETGGLVGVAYPGGLVATIDCSWSQPDAAATWGGLTLELVGTRGIASCDPFAERIEGFAAHDPRPVWIGIGVDLDKLMLSAFLAGVRTGVAPQPDGEAGLRSLRIVAAAQQAARTGDRVTVA